MIFKIFYAERPTKSSSVLAKCHIACFPISLMFTIHILQDILAVKVSAPFQHHFNQHGGTNIHLAMPTMPPPILINSRTQTTPSN